MFAITLSSVASSALEFCEFLKGGAWEAGNGERDLPCREGGSWVAGNGERDLPCREGGSWVAGNGERDLPGWGAGPGWLATEREICLVWVAGIDVDESNCFSDSSLLTRDFGFGSTHWIDVPCQMLVGFPA